MLIPSDRHTVSDLERWKELEAADHAYACLNQKRLQRQEDESLQVLAEFFSAGPGYVSTSWGKDSIVLCYLAWLHAQRSGQELPLVNLRVHPTRNPDCDAVRDAFLARFPLPYHEFHADYSPIDPRLPLSEWDRQTYRIWDAAWRDVALRFSDRRATGVRGAESNARSLRMSVFGFSTPRTTAPIGYWRTADIFAYMATHKLPIHPVYAMLGGGRWERERLRTAEIGDERGLHTGRRQWEQEYYGDVLRRLEAGR